MLALRSEYHNTKMFVLEKTHKFEEKLTLALDGQCQRLPSAQDAIALRQIRDEGDLRPLPDILSTLTETGYSDCLDAYSHGQRTSGVYILTLSDGRRIKAWCEQEKYGGGWTVFQRRQDGSVDFFRNWQDYKTGFGDVKGEYWLGNNAIRLLTHGRNQTLKVEMTRHDGLYGVADYRTFSIDNEESKYQLHIGGFSSNTIGDSLGSYNNVDFSTKDRDNDSHNGDCSAWFYGGWWYSACHRSNLNGRYSETGSNNPKGVSWYSWPDRKSHHTLTSARMMIRGA